MSTTPKINSYTGANVACSAVLLLLNHYIIDNIDPGVLHNCSHFLCFLSLHRRDLVCSWQHGTHVRLHPRREPLVRNGVIEQPVAVQHGNWDTTGRSVPATRGCNRGRILLLLSFCTGAGAGGGGGGGTAPPAGARCFFRRLHGDDGCRRLVLVLVVCGGCGTSCLRRDGGRLPRSHWLCRRGAAAYRGVAVGRPWRPPPYDALHRRRRATAVCPSRSVARPSRPSHRCGLQSDRVIADPQGSR